MRALVIGSVLLLALGIAARSAPADVAPSAADAANAAVIATRAGDYETAIAYFSAALEAGELPRPDAARVLAYRGLSEAALKRYDTALADLDRAIGNSADYDSDAYAYRGLLKLVTGHAAAAAADLVKGAELNVWSYSAMWLFLARRRAGLPDEGAHSLTAYAAMLDPARWPAPIIRVFLGSGTRQDAETAANADTRNLLSWGCDMSFYFAELDLATGNKDAARAGFEKAVKSCPLDAFERMGATAELGQL